MTARRITSVARLPGAPDTYDRAYMARLIQALEQRGDLEKQPVIYGYTVVSGYTPTRSINAATATATDVANFVSTLVDDLIAGGFVKKV